MTLTTHDSLGLKTFYADDVIDPSLPLDTLVFVHGLGGHSTLTWTHAESKAFWPVWLAGENVYVYPRYTGVMTFGYNANFKVFGPRVVLSISDCAIQLLKSLLHH